MLLVNKQKTHQVLPETKNCNFYLLHLVSDFFWKKIYFRNFHVSVLVLNSKNED